MPSRYPAANWLWEPDARSGAFPWDARAVIVEFWMSRVRREAPEALASQNLRSPATQPLASSRGDAWYECV